MPTIAVTGVTGFVGGHLARHFVARGFRVVALARRAPSLSGVEHRPYDLEKTLDEAVLAGVDCLVHCAYLPGEVAKNVAGAAALLAAARRRAVQKCIFVSSLSARADARSSYGRQKFEIESLFGERAGCALRLGLVLGNGGLYQRLSDHVRKGGHIPLIDGGRQPLQTAHIDDVSAAIQAIWERGLSGTITFAHPKVVTYRDFYSELCAALDMPAKFVPIPSGPLLLALTVAEWFRMPLPITRDNLLGLTQARAVDTTRDLQMLGLTPQETATSLRRLHS